MEIPLIRDKTQNKTKANPSNYPEITHRSLPIATTYMYTYIYIYLEKKTNNNNNNNNNDMSDHLKHFLQAFNTWRDFTPFTESHLREALSGDSHALEGIEEGNPAALRKGAKVFFGKTSKNFQYLCKKPPKMKNPWPVSGRFSCFDSTLCPSVSSQLTNYFQIQ